MGKSTIIVMLFCASFTFWWAWKLDAGPMIYRHSVPEKLEQKMKEMFMPYLEGRKIKSIRFGSKRAHISQNVPVKVESSGVVEEWLITNANTGPVLINVSSDDEITIHWDVPEDMPFDQSFNLIAQNLWDILIQYDQIMKVQGTYK